MAGRYPSKFRTWPKEKRIQWVDEYNASLPARLAKRALRREERKVEELALKQIQTPEGYSWLNTEVDPRKPSTGFDAGRTSWKFHAVLADSKATFQHLKEIRASSICGIIPRYGWGLDLFMDIDDEVAGKCYRCMKKLAALTETQ